MWILVLFALGCMSGFYLFRVRTVTIGGSADQKDTKLSVIIPARNEETNLPHLLHSLKVQTLQPYEIIVVNDFSLDRTRQIAESFGVKVIDNSELPPGWTGKNWAVWNGYSQSSGDLIAFLDADVRLVPRALEHLVEARRKSGGVISVIPYHYTEKWHEKLAMVVNILGVFAFTSPFERRNRRKGLYGSCIVTTREHYEKVKGHDSVKFELLDDLNLGAKYVEAGIPVSNFIGQGLVSFRMYPDGIKSEIQGFGKGAVLSTSTLGPGTVILTAIWVAGLIVAESAPFALHTSWAIPMSIGYAVYMLQMIYFNKYVGSFGVVIPVLHLLSGLFFIAIMLYSVYQVAFVGHVAWKGRQIKVGGRLEK